LLYYYGTERKGKPEKYFLKSVQQQLKNEIFNEDTEKLENKMKASNPHL
jgi:hypothetical protein